MNIRKLFLLIVGILAGLNFSFSQCGANEFLIFQERFTSEGDMDISGISDEGNGHSWNASLTTGPNNPADNHFFGVDGPFSNFESSNAVGEWETEEIDIECYESISFEINCLKFGADELDAEDFIEVEYSLNGGGSFTNVLSASTGFGGQLVMESGLMGTGFVLRVMFSSNQQGEILVIDDIIVCGVRKTPTFSGTFGPYCVGETADPLPSESDDSPPVEGTWSPATVNTSSDGVTTYTFIPDDPNCANEHEQDISVNPGPTANDAGPLTACLMINGRARYDLTQADNTVNGGTGLLVNYYEDAARTMPIGTPTSFEYNFGMPPGFPIILPSLTGEVYAEVVDGACVSDVAVVTLEAEVGDATDLDPLTICLDPVTMDGEVDLDDYNLQIIVSGGRVDWYGWEGFPNLPYFVGTGGIVTVDPPLTLYGVYIDGNDCIFIPSTLDIDAHPIPAANTPQSMRLCADENGDAIFDLTVRDPQIGSGTILWFEDDMQMDPIADPMSYLVNNSGSGILTTTVYAVNEDPSTMCRSLVVSMELLVDPFALATPVGPFVECSVPGTTGRSFDLTENDATIIGQGSYTVIWYEDPGGNTPIPDPTDFLISVPGVIVYAQVFGPLPTECPGEIIEVEYTMIQSPTLNAPEDKEICILEGSNSIIINLRDCEVDIYSGPGVITWYTDPTATNEILSPESYEAFLPLTPVYAVLTENGCPSDLIQLNFIERTAPDASPASIDACDEGGGFGTFDLTSLIPIITNGNGGNVLFYETYDGMELSSVISDPASYNTDLTLIYAVVDNGQCQSDVVEITLNIINQVDLNLIGPISVCADNMGNALLDLTNYNIDLLSGQAGTITWFEEDGITVVLKADSVIINSDTSFIAIAGFGTPCASDFVQVDFVLSTGINYSEPNNPFEICLESGDMGRINLDSYVDSIYNGSGNAVWTNLQGDTLVNGSNDLYNLPISLFLSLSEGECTSDTLIVFDFVPRDALNLNNTSLLACDSGNGMAIFDLTSVRTQIFNENGAVFTFYRDMALSSEILAPNSFSAADGTTVFVSVESGGCIGGPATIDLTVQDQIQACNFSLDTCSANGSIQLNLLNFNNEVNCQMGIGIPVTWYTDGTATTEIPAPGNYLSDGTSVWYIVGTGDCASDTLELMITINSAPTASPTTLEACDNGNGMGIFDLSGSNSAINGSSGLPVSWFSDQTLQNPIVDQSNFLASNGTVVYAIITENGCQSEPVQVTLNIINSPSFNVPVIDTCGNPDGTLNIDLTAFDNDVSFSGDILWFLDAGGTMPIADPTNFNASTGSIYAQVSINGCTSQIFEVPVSIRVCLCNNVAAELDPNNIDICLPGDAIVDSLPGRFQIDPGSDWQYVLHDGTSGMIGTILASNQTGIFPFNGYTIGQTYYIHMVVGPLDGNGDIILNDPCTDISDLGAAVRFLDTPGLENSFVSEKICVGDSVEITLTFDVGMIAYSFEMVDQTSGSISFFSTGVLAGNTYTFTFRPQNSGFYQINNLSYTGSSCPAIDPQKMILIELLEPTRALQLEVRCDEDNMFYTVRILVLGGNQASDYTLIPSSTHTGLFINDSVFVSEQIPVSDQSIFGFTNICGGNSSIVIPPPDCDDLCLSQAGILSIDRLVLCEDEQANLTDAGNILDNNDLVYFVIHDQPDLLNSALRIIQTSREVVYDPALTLNQTYYITMVVGNGDVNGGFDVNDPCLSLSNSVTILFMPIVNLQLVPLRNAYCFGDSLQFSVRIEGGSSASMTISGPSNVYNLSTVNDGDVVSFYEETSGFWNIVAADPGTTCLDLGNTVEVRISEPVVIANSISNFNGFDVSCSGLADGGVRLQTSNGAEPYIYSWSDNGVGFERRNLASGEYSVTVTDASGCLDSTRITLTEPPAIDFTLESINPGCFGANSGSVSILSISGGSGTGFKVAQNGFPIADVELGDLPYLIPDLAADDYEIGIFDSNNCYNSFSVQLTNPPARQINISRPTSGVDSLVRIGESIQLEFQSPYDFDSLIWTTAFDFECLDEPECEKIRVTPTESGEVILTALSEDGCFSTTSVFIMVDTERRIFTPSAFSPNADNNNDNFTLYSRHVEIIESIMVFDRWGNQVFNALNIPANDDSYGWDGSWKGEELNPSVFIWTATVKLIDGTTRILKGDITLLR